MAQIGGQQTKLAKGRRNRQEALRVLGEILAVRYAAPPPDSPGATVLSIVEAYTEWASSRVSARTISDRKRFLGPFLAAHGFRPVSQCIPWHLSSWVDSQTTWGSWPKDDAVKSVMAAFNWAKRQRLIKENPFRGVRHTRGPSRRPLTDDEWQAIMRAASGGYGARQRPSSAARFRQVLTFLRFSGARPQEASTLRWEHIDSQRGEIVQHEHKTATTQRTPRPRVIPLHPVVVKLLAWIRRHDPLAKEFVFVNYRGKPWGRKSLGQRFWIAKGMAGVAKDATLYGVRHQFGTTAIVNGIGLKTLSQLMGHSTVKMTERYIHLANQREHLGEAMRLSVKLHRSDGRRKTTGKKRRPSP